MSNMTDKLPVRDFYTGELLSDADMPSSKFRYSFECRKIDQRVWLYVNSFDDLNAPIVRNQVNVCVKAGGIYRIRENKTAKVAEGEGASILAR